MYRLDWSVLAAAGEGDACQPIPSTLTRSCAAPQASGTKTTKACLDTLPKDLLASLTQSSPLFTGQSIIMSLRSVPVEVVDLISDSSDSDHGSIKSIESASSQGSASKSRAALQAKNTQSAGSSPRQPRKSRATAQQALKTPNTIPVTGRDARRSTNRSRVGQKRARQNSGHDVLANVGSTMPD